MDLDVNGAITHGATAEDIARAIAARPSAGDWSIVLEKDENDYVQGFAESGEQFRITCRDKAGQFDGKELVDGTRLTHILTGYLNGDAAWREAVAWDRQAGAGDELPLLAAVTQQIRQTRAGKRFKGAPGELSPLTILGAIAVVCLFLAAVFSLNSFEEPLSHLPWPFDTYAGQMLLLVALVPIAITFIVARSKLGNIHRAAGWPATAGRVIESSVKPNRSDSTISNPLFENLPNVRYEFTVAGRKLVGDRISFGDDTGGANTEATLARYPVGGPVTVFYDPADPTDSVLEREAPKGLAKGCLALTAIALIAVAVLAMVGGWALDWIAAHMVQARNPEVATFAGLMGIASILLAFGFWRTMTRAAAWPAAEGVITFSGVQKSRDSIGTGGSRSTMTTYRPKIEYSYQVNGHGYIGHQITLGLTVAGAKAAAEAKAARYPLGAKITVHFNPANPGEAAIEHNASVPLIPLALGLALVAFALYQAGVY